jgi:O-succinylbenzoic acid--CoA ligase
VVPMSETAGVDGDAIRDAIRLELGPAAVPKQITVTSELPLLPVGKVDKQALERRGHDH